MKGVKGVKEVKEVKEVMIVVLIWDLGFGASYPEFQTFPNALRLLFLSFLKCEGVSPVIFLNWLERCATEL